MRYFNNTDNNRHIVPLSFRLEWLLLIVGDQIENQVRVGPQHQLLLIKGDQIGNLVFPRISLCETVHEQESGPIIIIIFVISSRVLAKLQYCFPLT